MSRIIKDIISEINYAQIQKGRGLLLYEMRPIMEKYIAKIERPQGEWVSGKRGELFCSVCGCSALYHEYGEEQCSSDFCPNCGAEMKTDKGDSQ